MNVSTLTAGTSFRRDEEVVGFKFTQSNGVFTDHLKGFREIRSIKNTALFSIRIRGKKKYLKKNNLKRRHLNGSMYLEIVVLTRSSGLNWQAN